MTFKKFRTSTRQKITIQVRNNPWRSFVVTLVGGFLAGLATAHFLPFM